MEQLPKLCRDPHLMRYVTDTFGGVEECRKQILQDFFRLVVCTYFECSVNFSFFSFKGFTTGL